MANVSYSFQNVKPEFGLYFYDYFLTYDANETVPTVASLADGGFALSYRFQEPASSEVSIYVERYGSDGAFRPGSEDAGPIRLDPFDSTFNEVGPTITQLIDGNILTTWTRLAGGIHYAIVNPATGLKTTSDTLLPGTTSSDFAPDVVALRGGGFAVAKQANLSASDQDADLLIYNSAGTKIAEHFLGANSILNEQAPSVAELHSGNIVVAYEKEKADGSNTYNMAVEIFTATGATVLAPFNFDTTGSQNRAPDVVELRDGGFAVAYQDDQYANGGLSVAFFTSDGSLRGVRRADIDSVQNLNPSLSVLANGYVVITFTDAISGNNNIRVVAFDPLAMSLIQGPIGLETQSGDQYEPSVAALANGTFVTAWTDANNVLEDGNTDEYGTHVSLQIDAYVRTTTSGAAAETLRGDALRDVFIGGAGDDKFVYARNGNADTINDFIAGADSGDVINFSGFSDTHTSFDAIARAVQVGANTVFDFGNDDTLTLLNVTKTNLTADDFSFVTFDSNVTLGLNSFGSSAAGGGWSSQNYYPREMADVNGDGRADIVGFGSAGTYVALGSGNGFAPVVLGINGFGAAAAAGGWSNNDAYHRTLADVNGDGRADIVGFGGDGTFVSLATINGQFANPVLGINSFGASAVGGGWSSDDLYHREVADVNGDGKADIVGFGSAGVYVSLATSNGQFAAPIFSLNSFGSSDAAGGWSSDNIFHRELADVNGDGKADIVGFGGAGVYVGLATSNGNFAAPTALALNSFGFSAAGGSWTSQDQFPRHLADINADGRADIVGFGSASTFIAYGNANGTFTAPTADLASFGQSAAAGGWSSDDLYPRMLADIDGGGAADIIGFGSAGVYVSHSNVDWLV